MFFNLLLVNSLFITVKNTKREPNEINQINHRINLIYQNGVRKTNLYHFLQSKLVEHYNKAQGAHGHEPGGWKKERKIQEKQWQENINKSLIINDVECTDLKQIFKNVEQFYSNSFTSSFSKQNSKKLFLPLMRNLKTFVKRIF